MIVDAPVRINGRTLKGLGDSLTVSRPDLLRQAEAIGNAAGYPTTCTEVVQYTPGGGYYNRLCSAKCPSGYVQSGFRADLIVESPEVFKTEIAGICAAVAAPPPPPPPANNPPPTNQQTSTPPANNPPPTNQKTSPPPANQSTPQKVVEELTEEASRIWKQITAGDASTASTSAASTQDTAEATTWLSEIPMWVWIVAAASAAYLFARKDK